MYVYIGVQSSHIHLTALDVANTKVWVPPSAALQIKAGAAANRQRVGWRPKTIGALPAETAEQILMLDYVCCQRC
jgi:hypothetical protein